jgi:outer membrane protein, heavy metal efflux system
LLVGRETKEIVNRVQDWTARIAAFVCAFSASGFAQSSGPSGGQLTLAAATDALIAKNLTVLAARYNVDLFRAQRVAAALKPSSTVVIGANQFAIPRVFSHPRYLAETPEQNVAVNTTYSLDVEKVIERGGKRELRIAQANIQTGSAEAQLADALRQQIFQLKQAFLSAVLARENLRVVRGNLDDFKRTQDLLATQVKEGYSAGVDLRRISLDLVEFQGDIGAAEQGYMQSLRDVFNLIGEAEAAPPGPFVQLASCRSSAQDPPILDALYGDLDVRPISIDIEEIRRRALAGRPDLRAAQMDSDAAAAALRLAEAEGTRDITVGGQYVHSGSDSAVGVAVGVPISTRARARAAMAQATAAKLQAEARLRQARAQVLTDVEKAYIAYRTSRDRLSLFDGQVLRNASEVRDIEQVAYREGARSLLSFLDAQRAYNKTLVGYNQARYDFALSVYQLEMAAGVPLTN